jgi:hypothetical protein
VNLHLRRKSRLNFSTIVRLKTFENKNNGKNDDDANIIIIITRILTFRGSTSMRRLLLFSYYYIFFRYLFLPYILKQKDRMATKGRHQEFREKAIRLSNIITDSPYFSKLVDWAYGVCDPEGTNQIGKHFT